MVVSGAGVSWQTLRYGRSARGAVFAVPLLSESAPGRRSVFPPGPRYVGGGPRTRRRTMHMPRRVLAALGTPEELATAEAHLVRMGRT